MSKSQPDQKLVQWLSHQLAHRVFPKAPFVTKRRVLDDLNLEAMKAVDLGTTALKQGGVSEAIDPATLRNMTLADGVAEPLQGYRLRVLEAQPHPPNTRELAFPERRDQHPLQLVERANAKVPPHAGTPHPAETPIDSYRMIASSADREYPTADRPQAQPVYEQRFPVTFKDGCSMSRKVTVSQYISWVGKMRELPLQSLAADLIPDVLCGEWDMVTTMVNLRVLGDATTYDTIQARCWIGNVINSTFDTYIEFCKVLPDERLERVALADVRATWVQPVSDDVPLDQPFPAYLQAYLDRCSINLPAAIALKNTPTTTPQTHLSGLHAGAMLYRPQSHRYGDLLLSEVFQTTLEESNLVGNIYYGTYFTWQGRLLDLFLYTTAPEYLRVPTPQGEMISLYSRIDFRQEAMPFDRIQVSLYVQSVSECGAVFKFEFFRERSMRCKEKLHTGQQEVLWVERQPDGTPMATPWPQSIRQALMRKQTSESLYAATIS